MKDKHSLMPARHRNRSLPLLSMLSGLLIMFQLLIVSVVLADSGHINSTPQLSQQRKVELVDVSVIKSFINPTFQAADIFALLAKQKISTATLISNTNSQQSTQSTSTGDSIVLTVGIVASTSAFITLVVLIFIIFRPAFINSEGRLEHVRKKGKEALTLIVRGINNLTAGLETWWTNLQAARKGTVIPSSHLLQLPEGIKVIKQNTTRPLVKPCPNCQKNARANAAFCPNCGTILPPPGAMPKPTIKLQPYGLEPVSDKLPATPVTGELDEEVPEIVHIDLMLKVKLYLLWDKAGR